MNATVQALLVFAIVGAATGYATLKFMPGAWRRSLAGHVATMASRSGWSEASVRRVEAKLSSGGACGSCDSCKACATPSREEGEETTSVASSPSISTHRRIPIRPVS